MGQTSTKVVRCLRSPVAAALSARLLTSRRRIANNLRWSAADVSVCAGSTTLPAIIGAPRGEGRPQARIRGGQGELSQSSQRNPVRIRDLAPASLKRAHLKAAPR
jgi:hypothetical protein